MNTITTYVSEFRDELAQLITSLHEQLQEIALQQAQQGEFDERLLRGGQVSIPPSGHKIVADLTKRIERLEQVHDWIDEDEELSRLIDSVISKRVKAAEKRQARFNILLNLAFLLAGWALSLVANPQFLLGLFHH